MPQELYDDLRQSAEAHQRSMAEEALERLRWLQRRRLPDEPFVTGEISAPCTIPLPELGRLVLAKRVPPRLPDPPWTISEPK
ncbi:MAG TPA: Arc family DNA-binding protein [Isosphaeraceae bacterium]|nr:Arc family DNA-binding protein [Isosphaeraceae bacterium]